MFYDSGSRLRDRKSETWIGSRGNQKSISPTKGLYFSHIPNTYNDSRKIRIPFKYELNDSHAKLSSNSPKSSLYFRSKQNESDFIEKTSKKTSKNRAFSSSLNIRPQSSTVKENVIKSLDITSYSFNLKKNSTFNLKINSHSKTISKSDSQFSPKSKISSKKSDIKVASSHSSDEYIINKDIRDTFHSKNEMPKIKAMNSDESIKQDNNFCLQINEKKKIDYYKQFLIMKFRNSDNLSGDQNEKINYNDKNESKLLYELAYEENQKNDDKKKSEVKYVPSHAEITELIYDEEEIMNIKNELIKKEEEINKKEKINNEEVTNNEEANKEKATNNEEVTNSEEANNEEVTNNEEANKEKATNNKEKINNEEVTNNEETNKEKATNNEETNKEKATNNKEITNKEKVTNNKEITNKEKTTNNESNNEETTNKEEVDEEEEESNKE